MQRAKGSLQLTSVRRIWFAVGHFRDTLARYCENSIKILAGCAWLFQNLKTCIMHCVSSFNKLFVDVWFGMDGQTSLLSSSLFAFAYSFIAADYKN